MINKNVVAGVLVIFFCFFGHAQEKIQSKPLIDVIRQLEERFNYSFSFADATIENIQVKLPGELNTLVAAVQHLEKQTALKFTILENNIVVISTANTVFKRCGYLIDYDTKEPIQNVLVSTRSNSFMSEENGYFEIKVASKNELISFKHFNYKSIQYLYDQMDPDKCKELFLLSRVERMKEIVIRNYLTKGIRKTADGNFDINYKNFGILPGLIEPDVLQTLQALPGVQSVDERVSNINIRGGSHYENLILWDGIKMYQSGHFFGLISAFNPYLTKNVKLIKNGTKANLSDGISGTIQMFTDDEINHELNTSVGLNMINADVFMDIPISSFSSVQVAARKSISEVFRTPTYEEYFLKAFQDSDVLNNELDIVKTNNEFSFHDINIRGLYNPSSRDFIKINFLLVNNDLLFTENALIGGDEESKESSAAQRNLAASAYYKRAWNDDFTTEVQLYASNYELGSTNVDLLNEQRLIQKNEVIEESVKFDSKHRINDQMHVYNGYQYVETGISNIQDVDNPLYKSTVKEVIRSHGLSTELGYQSPNTFTSLRAGARLNYLEKFEMLIAEPRFSFSQRFLNKFTIELLGEMKHQTTTQIIDFQNDFLGVENRRWVLVNNTSIPVIKSRQVSTGFHYNNGGWLVSTEGYYKYVEGITTQSQEFQNQYQYVKSSGSYEVYGLDVLINKRFQNISTWLSYSVAENNYLFEELSNKEFANNIDIRHALAFGLSYSKKKLKVSTGMNWHSGKPTTDLMNSRVTLAEEINYGAANASRLEDYLRFDFSAQYSFQLGQKSEAYIGVAIWNILGANNITNRYYSISNGQIDQIQQTSLGFTPNTSFRLKF